VKRSPHTMGGQEAEPKLDWILANNVPERGTTEYKMNKLKENPFVPIGCLSTAVILGVGVSSMTWSDKRWSNWLMRARITSQAVTVVAIIAGTYYASKSKEAPSS